MSWEPEQAHAPTMATTHVDPRIVEYRQAAQALTRGEFHPDIPAAPEDEIGLLGLAILEVGNHLERKYHEIDTLTAITEKVNQGLLIGDVLERVYEAFRPFIPYDRIGFSLLSADGSTLTAHWARTEADDPQIGEGYSAPMAGSSLEPLLAGDDARMINDLEAYLVAKPQSESTELIVAEGMRSSLTCPLIGPHGALGFMFFSSTRTNTYSDVHVSLFKQIAGQLAAVLDKSRLYEDLLEANTLKNRLLGAAAHDLRSPIAVITGFAEVLRDGGAGELTSRQAELLEHMATEANHMRDILGDLLDMAAIESGAVEVTRTALKPAALLRQAASAHRVLAEHKAQSLRIEIEHLPIVEWDARRVRQILDNLLSNATKYTEPGGEVTLSARPRDGGVQIEVSDNGQGIRPDELPHVFDDFVTTSAQPTAGEASTGLGLAIVRRLVAALSGTISVESLEGEGSTFVCWLPAA